MIHSILSITFIALFLAAAALQVYLLLRLAHVMARRAARAGLDPDNHVVPYLTATGDALGTAFLITIASLVGK